MLDNIRIILIETSHPGNIGSAARAMKTMGMKQLVLINPKQFPDTQAKALAAGADDVLENAVITDSLTDALRDCQLVIGASARSRSLPWPLLNPPQAAEKIVQESRAGNVALLFGREQSGLTNEELQACHFHVQIPANPDYSSLNLAAAVQIIAYEIRMAHEQKNIEPSIDNTHYATADAMELFYEHLEQILQKVEFIRPEHPNRIMPRLRRLFSRARPNDVELNILRGMLTEIGKKILM